MTLAAPLKSETASQELLHKLLASSLIHGEDWQALSADARAAVQNCPDTVDLLDQLIAAQLLTPYQANRVSIGKRFGLILGNYRVLERIGVGGMGVVYKAEHLRMRRPVAIKVLSMTEELDPQLLQRFDSEMRTLALLQHANIVSAFDAGEMHGPTDEFPTLYYYVMEYVPGEDLESHVQKHGPLPTDKACALVYQVASALAEAHRHHLVHRDIKPSNILLTKDGQAKVVDFGLARHFRNRLTEPGTVLGTVDYIAPEQAKDSSQVDIRADIYSLGGTLFWCLTGKLPFPPQSSVTQDLVMRLTQNPPSARSLQSHVPVELNEVVQRMMALDPADRHQTPEAVMRALLPFLDWNEHGSAIRRAAGMASLPPATSGNRLSAIQGSVLQRVLIVDDDADIRCLCCHTLRAENIECQEAGNGEEALTLLASRRFDLVLLDIDMPGMTGVELCRRLREQPPCPNLKIVFFSGRTSANELARLLLSGGDDFITKPFSTVELHARIRAALRLKQAQDRSERLTQNLLQTNAELEKNLCSRDSDLVHARNALVLSLAKLVEQRHSETGAHLTRMQRYSRLIAEEASQCPPYHDVIDLAYIQMLECCAPLHDIGKVALPDHILMKPGKLTADERIIMQTHTTIGAETLHKVAQEHGSALAFLGMAIDIARHHHERFDGSGYPDRLVGANIPLSARLVTLADVYDALRSRRVYKPALSHTAALQIMKEASEGQFDPNLLVAFDRAAPRLDAVFRDLMD